MLRGTPCSSGALPAAAPNRSSTNTRPACPPARPARWRSPEHVQLLVLGDLPLFFSTRDGGWFPTLRVGGVTWLWRAEKRAAAGGASVIGIGWRQSHQLASELQLGAAARTIEPPTSSPSLTTITSCRCCTSTRSCCRGYGRTWAPSPL